MVQPGSSFSMLRVADVLMLSGVRFAPPSCADSAMEKHAACAAAISSSGFVPGASSNRVLKEYLVFERIPLAEETVPWPSLRLPFHTALALRSIFHLLFDIDKIVHPHCRSWAGKASFHCRGWPGTPGKRPSSLITFIPRFTDFASTSVIDPGNATIASLCMPTEGTETGSLSASPRNTSAVQCDL